MDKKDIAIKSEQRFFQKVDRILSQRDTIRVRQGAPRTNAIRDIWLPFETMARRSKDYPDYLMKMKGVNYHELAHILWTDISMIESINIAEDYMYKKIDNMQGMLISKQSIHSLINRLEDCRIETKFALVYPKSIEYFSRVVYWAIANNNSVGFFDIYGRKFLNKDLRKKYTKEFLKLPYGKEIKDLVDEFLKGKTGEDRSITVGKILVVLIKNNVFKIKEQQLGHRDGFGKGYSDDKLGKQKREELDEELDDMVDEDAKTIEEELELDEDDVKPEDLQLEPEKETDDDEETENENAEKESVEGDGDESGDDDDDSELGETKSTDKPSSSGKSTDKKEEEEKELEELPEEIKEAIKEKSESLMNEVEEQVEDDLRQDIETIKSGGGYSPWGKGRQENDFYPFKLTEDMENMKRRKEQVKRVINEARIALKEQVRRNQKRGQMDMKSAMNSKRTGSTRIFKRQYRNIGRETRLATCILVDRSGSMGYDLVKALRSSWSIRKALEETNNEVCEMAFNTKTTVIKDWKGNANYDVTSEGGTSPHGALYISKLKIDDVKQFDRQLIPLIIIVTDGCYNPAYSSKDIVNSMRRELGEVFVAEINLHEASNDSYIREREKVYDFVEYCPNIDQLSEKMESILKQIEAKFRERRKWL